MKKSRSMKKGASGNARIVRAIAHACLLVISVALLSASAACFHYACQCQTRASPAPSPQQAGSTTTRSGTFPVVDWTYWKEINPDVCAWITIPGTNVNHPVVSSARKGEAWYLDHDVFNENNPCGALVLTRLDKEANAPAGLLIFGHNMSDGSMFSPVSRYSNDIWKARHPSLLLQTPQHKWHLDITHTRIVDASSTTAEQMLLPDSLLLSTCSYGTYENQRTLVYAKVRWEN